MPRLGRRTLERAAAEIGQPCQARIEDVRLARHLALIRKFLEPGSGHRPHPLLLPEPDRRMVDEGHLQLPTDRSQPIHERINGATGWRLSVLVHTYKQEAVISELPSRLKRRSVRSPLRQERVDLSEHGGALGIREAPAERKDPEAAMFGQIFEGNPRHS